MEKLMLQWSQLQQLYLLKGVCLDSQFKELDKYNDNQRDVLEVRLIERAILHLVDTRRLLLLEIESSRKEIILAFHREYEICLLDYKQERKIESFSGR